MKNTDSRFLYKAKRKDNNEWDMDILLNLIRNI